MKNKFLILLIAASMMMPSCATVLGGQKTDHQATKPECGQPRRQIRPGFLIVDLLIFPPFLVVDFLTEKIYKPEPRSNKIKKCKSDDSGTK